MAFNKIITIVLLSFLSYLPASTFDCEKYKASTLRLVQSGKSAVSHDLSGGRFGDSLICYLHAKWISYKYSIPLLYYPFEYSDQLVLSDAELLVTVGNASSLKKEKATDIEPITQELFVDTVKICPDEGILYIIPWFPESIQEYERIEDGRLYFYVNWDDEKFLEEIRKLISPKKKLDLLQIPSDKITVAVHVRRNSNGFDLALSFDENLQVKEGRQFLDDYYPFKCVDDNFYISSIKKLCELFPNRSIYIYIFTDDKDPEKIAEKYKNALSNPLITFDYRHDKHDHTVHVLEDFFFNA
ncbi:MAG: hypothetical protein V1646_00380 [bacterium]